MELLEQKEAQLPLARLFDTASARVLDFLLANEGLEYTENEISELAAVPNRTLQRNLRSLLAEQVIKRDKKGDRVYRYSANVSSLRVSGLLDYINATLISNLDRAIDKNSRQK